MALAMHFSIGHLLTTQDTHARQDGPMSRIIPTFTVMIALVICGLVHGLRTNRWNLSAQPAATAARLASVPLQLDGWTGEAFPTDKLGRGMAGCLHHRYTQQRSGRTVTVFLVCDRPGPVSIHTPDVCYEGIGYEVTKRTRFTPRGGTAAPAPTFWTARFHKKRADASDLRIFWSWSGGEGWQAADDPRMTFARFAVLCKVYFIEETSVGDEIPADDPAVDLIRQLLPELERALFAS
jgi:hypothetical protein